MSDNLWLYWTVAETGERLKLKMLACFVTGKPFDREAMPPVHQISIMIYESRDGGLNLAYPFSAQNDGTLLQDTSFDWKKKKKI